MFASLLQLRADALVIGPDSLSISRSERLGALAVRYAVPAILQFRPFAAAGGLMSYGSSVTDAFRQTGAYAGRIRGGSKLDTDSHLIMRVACLHGSSLRSRFGPAAHQCHAICRV